jgi:hypothetical protein
VGAAAWLRVWSNGDLFISTSLLFSITGLFCFPV